MGITTPVPYKGNDPYLFVSYAHKDMELVYPIISWMNELGLKVWFDEAIAPATEWPDYVARHVMECDAMIAFISANYLASDNCKDELNFARDHQKNRLLVYLEDVQLPPGMAMRMNRLQAIYQYRYTRQEDFYAKMLECDFIHRNVPETQEVSKPDEPTPAVPAAPAQADPGSSMDSGIPAYLLRKKTGTGTASAAQTPANPFAVDYDTPIPQFPDAAFGAVLPDLSFIPGPSLQDKLNSLMKDIESKEFKTVIWGYSRIEVDEFLDNVLELLESSRPDENLFYKYSSLTDDKTFSKESKGYSPKEVDGYLTEIGYKLCELLFLNNL